MAEETQKQPVGGWPRVAEYIAAVEASQFDPSGPLAGSRVVEGGLLGGPIAVSGRNAVVFRMVGPEGEPLALRCFLTRPEANIQLVSQMAEYELDDLAPIPKQRWLPFGVWVRDEWYPVVVMPWIEGETLDRWVETNRANADAVTDVSKRMVRILLWLESRGLVHGDLQHGNIVIDRRGDLWLIDNDSLTRFDPDGRPSTGWKLSEVAGHPNYSHPETTNTSQWSAANDVFAGLLIVLSLKAIAADPSLVEKFPFDDSLLTRADDFRDLSESAVWSAIGETDDEEVDLRRYQVETACGLSVLTAKWSASQLLEENQMPQGQQFVASWWATEPQAEAVSVWGDW